MKIKTVHKYVLYCEQNIIGNAWHKLINDNFIPVGHCDDTSSRISATFEDHLVVQTPTCGLEATSASLQSHSDSPVVRTKTH